MSGSDRSAGGPPAPAGRPPLQRVYTRSDPRGRFPVRTGLPDLDGNRLGLFWRPMVDLVDSAAAPLRLRMVAPVSAWLAEGADGRWPEFSAIGVPGQRHQVLRHAGLDRYDCREPTGLPEPLRTPGWQTLVDAVGRFPALSHSVRSLVVFQLLQLSYCEFALRLAGAAAPDGRPEHDRHAYDVARAHARYPGHLPVALDLFGRLAGGGGAPLLRLAACFQGIGHALRAGDPELARAFDRRGQAVGGVTDDWYGALVRSRFLRAVALLRLAEGRAGEAGRTVREAGRLHEPLLPAARDRAERMVVLENARYLLEGKLQVAVRTGTGDVRALCARLGRLDPSCVEARLTGGDGYAAVGDLAAAAVWYARAGELGTAAGAVGWFRAAQCHDALGERAAAVNAMGRCLELDATAVEPRAYLAAVAAAPARPRGDLSRSPGARRSRPR